MTDISTLLKMTLKTTQGMWTLALVTLFMGGLSGRAQPVTITQAHMPMAGDTLRYSVAANSSITLPIARGAGQTWSYTQLTPLSQGVRAFRNVLQVNPLYALALGPTAYGTLVADTLSLGFIQLTSVYDFYARSAQRFARIGQGAQVSGVGVPSRFQQEDRIFSFPLTLGSRDSSRYRSVVTLPGQGTLSQNGVRIVEAIGQGAITTPYGTFQALLVRSQVTTFDTLVSTLLPIPIPISQRTATYQWLSTQERLPILTVVARLAPFGNLEVVQEVTYRDIRRSVAAAAPIPDFAALRRFLPVGDSTFLINLTQGPRPMTYQWTVTPAAGVRYADGTTAQSEAPVLAFSLPGLYTVNLRVTGPGGSRDTTQVDFITVTGALRAQGRALSADQPLLRSGLTPDGAALWVVLKGTSQQDRPMLIDAHGKPVQAWPVIRLTPGLSLLPLRGSIPSGVYTLVTRQGALTRLHIP